MRRSDLAAFGHVNGYRLALNIASINQFKYSAVSGDVVVEIFEHFHNCSKFLQIFVKFPNLFNMLLIFLNF